MVYAHYSYIQARGFIYWSQTFSYSVVAYCCLLLALSWPGIVTTLGLLFLRNSFSIYGHFLCVNYVTTIGSFLWNSHVPLPHIGFVLGLSHYWWDEGLRSVRDIGSSTGCYVPREKSHYTYLLETKAKNLRKVKASLVYIVAYVRNQKEAWYQLMSVYYYQAYTFKRCWSGVQDYCLCSKRTTCILSLLKHVVKKVL